MKPLCIDLFCGLGGWAEGFLAEGWDVVGFDVERHRYPRFRVTTDSVKLPGNGTSRNSCDRPISRLNEANKFNELIEGEWDEYPGQLVLQDVLTLHGSQFSGADVIVASPPCQAYSYRAMPWRRAKALPPPDNTLFDACFRIQREASEAAGRYIPMVVENVRGAGKWVGPARWHYGSYYLWGDVPALMPITTDRRMKFPAHCGPRMTPRLNDGSVSSEAHRMHMRLSSKDGNKLPEGHDTFKRTGKPCNKLTDPRYGSDGLKFGGGWWHDSTNNLIRKASSKSNARKAASAQIAKIPFPLAQWIARVFKPDTIAANEHQTAIVRGGRQPD